MRYTGFQTAHGSVYTYDQNGRTSRLKASEGKGQGKLNDPAFCLFIDAKGLHAIESLYLGTGHLTNRIGLGSYDPVARSFIERDCPAEIPSGQTPCIIIQERATKKMLAYGSATLEPSIGLYPVEKSYKDDQSITHVGNTIIRLFDTETQVQAALSEARSKLLARPSPRAKQYANGAPNAP